MCEENFFKDKNILAMTYCPTKKQYRRRWRVSLLCSEREEVVPHRSNHQEIFIFKGANMLVP